MMLIQQKWLILGSNVGLLWMFLNTFVTNSTGIAVVLMTLILGGIQYVRIEPLHANKISEAIASIFKVDPKKPNKNTIFHKAGGHHAPENTLEAVHQAIKLGVPAVEIDLEITKDGVGVVHHGPDIDDTTDGTGTISNLTHAYIKTLNAAANHQNRDQYPFAKVPTIDELLKVCVDNGLVVFIDCKADAQRTVNMLHSLYQKYPALYGLGVVCSFNPYLIYLMRQTDENIVTAVTFREHYLTLANEDGTERYTEWWKRLLAPLGDFALSWAHRYLIWFLCGNSFFLCSSSMVNMDTKRMYENCGVRLVAWTVNDPQEKRYLLNNLGVPVITDGLNMPSTSSSSIIDALRQLEHDHNL